MATGERVGTSPRNRPPSAEILDRAPPHSHEAEQAVLGSLLLDPQMCDEVATILRPEDFYADANARLYRHLLEMHESGNQIDATLLLERLRRAGELETIGGMAYLAETAAAVPHAAHATYYANIVRDKATLRLLIHASGEILRDAYDPTVDPAQMVSEAEQRIFAVHDARSRDQVTNIHDLLVEAFDRIDARLERGEGVGTPTGFRDLDNLTGGLHDSELVILAARPSMGKTALATNIAEYVTTEADVPTLFVSLEMARLELAQRMLCSQGKIDANKFRSGFLSGDDRQKLVEASARLGKAPLFVDDTPSRTVTEIAACARRLKRRENLGLVVMDYLQLVQPDNPRDPRQEQVARMTRRLKALARELKIPILCLAQLNRQPEATRESHRPRLSHLRESGAIEQDADVVLFIHREEYYHPDNEEEKGKADLIVAKQRNGPTGTVKLTWLSRYTRFEDLAERSFGEFDPYAAADDVGVPDEPLGDPF